MTVLSQQAPGSDLATPEPAKLASPTLEASVSDSHDKVPLSYWLLIPFAFITALSAALLHNFSFCESRIVLATDGKHFLTTIQLLVQFLNHIIFHAPLSPTFLADSQLAGHILLDGPLMSAIYAPLFVVLGKIPDPRDWMTLVIAQSIMHATSTSGLVYLVLRVTRVPLFAAVAVLLYGLYPAAILQTGHFMSEIPVTLLLIGFMLSLTGTKSRWLLAIGGGIAAGIIALSKPALMPCIAIVAAIGVFRAHQKSKTVVGLLAGLMMVLGAWASFSYAATGKFNPTAQRQPLYNVVTGWNHEANGWAFNPHPPLTDIYTENEGPLYSAAGIWKSNPNESLRLAISKLSRLSSCPWNDFKGRALGLDANAQILFHRLVLCFAAFGAAIYFWCARRFLNHTQKTIVLSSFAIVLAHLAYLMVECQPRYIFTAMPFVVLLAAYGIWQAAKLPFEDKQRRLILASSAAFALVLVGALINAENICSYFDPRNFKEREHALEKKQFVEKLIYLGGVRTPRDVDKVFLFVDGNKNLEDSKIVVNGVTIKEPLRSTMHFDGLHYLLFDQMREFAPAMRVSVNDFRQWRAVPVSKHLIRWNGPNRIVITAQSKDSVIYSDGRHVRYSYSPDYCNYGVLAAAPLTAGAESRYIEPILTAKCIEESFISPDPKAAEKNAETDPEKGEDVSKLEKLKGSLRIKLAVVPAATETSMQTETAGRAEAAVGTQSAERTQAAGQAGSVGQVKSAQTGSAEPPAPGSVATSVSDKNSAPPSVKIDVNRKSFDPVLYDTNSLDALRMNKTVLYAARRIGADFPVAKIAPSSHIELRIKGNLKALHNAGEVGILCAIKGQNGHVQILGRNPRALQAKPNWKQFEIKDLIPTDLFGGSVSTVELALYPCPWMEGQYGVSRRACDALFKDITIELKAKELPSLAGRRRIIY